MTPVPFQPTLNAVLNSLSAIFLVSGYILIRRNRIQAHKTCMLGACGTSILFLISYLIYHYQTGSTAFSGQGPVRIAYFAILITHTVLAVVILPMVIVTLRRAWRQDFPLHARIARKTFPLWLYVSITGVVVYWMLYRL